MALFGAPVAHENDPERALRAALEMMEAIAAFNREHATALDIHVGVDTGHVIAGEIGARGRRDYSVIGDAVNLASRLEGASPNGQIYVGPSFAVTVLSNPAAQNAVLELGGPETHSQLEVVRIFEEIGGRAFEKQFVPEEALQVRKAAATNPVERTFADLTLAAARGERIDMGETFKKFSVRPRLVREHAKAVMHGAPQN